MKLWTLKLMNKIFDWIWPIKSPLCQKVGTDRQPVITTCWKMIKRDWNEARMMLLYTTGRPVHPGQLKFASTTHIHTHTALHNSVHCVSASVMEFQLRCFRIGQERNWTNHLFDSCFLQLNDISTEEADKINGVQDLISLNPKNQTNTPVKESQSFHLGNWTRRVEGRKQLF